MQLLVIRHAKSEDTAAWSAAGGDESSRPLTNEGCQDMNKAAAGLRQLLDRLDVVASSPLQRGIQTAEILSAVFGGLKVITRDELLPDAPPEKLMQWIATQKADAVIAVIGHEPHLSRCVSWLLTDDCHPIVEMKKASACLLQSRGKIAPGKCTLQWLLTRRQLSRQR